MKKAIEDINTIGGGSAGFYESFRESLNKMYEWFGSFTGKKEPASEPPNRSVGTNLVTKEGLAYVHAGERIIPKKFANDLTDTGPYKSKMEENYDAIFRRSFDTIRTLQNKP